ncbi:hypothetical protein MKX03_002194 [Papaver bracteatum]|nr:hypothetical protein MKX03_002194 [Papaver bracteatum]
MAYKNSGLFRFWRLGGSSSSDAEDYTAGAVTKFKYRELEAATNYFAIESLLGEGEHGRTYKGRFKRTRQVVAVKQVNGENISDIYGYSEQSILWTIHWRRNAEMKLDLIEWAKRKLVGGEEFTGVADPLLKGHYPEQGLYQALYLAAECLETCNVSRPRIGHAVNVLSNLASEIYDPDATQINPAGTLTVGNFEKERLRNKWRHVRFLF